VLAGLGAAYVLRPARGVPDGAPTQDEMAGSIGSHVMEHLHNGAVPGRSGEVMLVPKPYSFLIGEWDLSTLGSATPTTSTSHPNPWNYLTRVPIIMSGPGIAEGRVSTDEVDISQVAPTYASILGGVDGFDVEAPPLPGIQTSKRPKVIFTVVIDGGGWNDLQQHADAWPFLRSLREQGTTFVNATIGSAPSITGALHATFGTGVYPKDHGINGNQMRDPDGTNVDTWLDNADPRYLEQPTVSELWDEQNGNKPVVATVAYEGWHLGMIGHGAQREGGDKDVAVLWKPEENSWWVNEDYYALPDYLQVTDLAKLESYEGQLDARDGLSDGTWYGHTLEQLQEDLVRPGTPAFVRFTGDAVVDVIRNENVGGDNVTDMVWIEMKMPDYAGHAWNMLNREQEDVLRETDRQIQRFHDELDRIVGKGNYVFAVSADHGQQPLPDLYGGWRINSSELQRDINDRFGSIVEKVTPVDVYFDRDAVEREGVDLEDVARYMGTYTLGDNLPDGAPGIDLVPQGRLDELLFAGGFTVDFLSALTPDEIDSYGCGDYKEGNFSITEECTAK
jgi:predicted AlkP superfamily pyrophosphatase or phosphodiesterase